LTHEVPATAAASAFITEILDIAAGCDHETGTHSHRLTHDRALGRRRQRQGTRATAAGAKMVLTAVGPVDVAVPRDRSCEPVDPAGLSTNDNAPVPTMQTPRARRGGSDCPGASGRPMMDRWPSMLPR
jgi:hypothetical protein